MHIWSNVAGKPYKILNNVYNKVWRRIFGDPRYTQVVNSDQNVRKTLGVPSLDCHLRRKRLLYLVRLARQSLPSLNLLLQTSSPCGARVPWINTIISDLKALQSALGTKLASLPDPSVDPAPWWEIICKHPSEWRLIVLSYVSYVDFQVGGGSEEHGVGHSNIYVLITLHAHRAVVPSHRAKPLRSITAEPMAFNRCHQRVCLIPLFALSAKCSSIAEPH